MDLAFWLTVSSVRRTLSLGSLLLLVHDPALSVFRTLEGVLVTTELVLDLFLHGLGLVVGLLPFLGLPVSRGCLGKRGLNGSSRISLRFLERTRVTLL